MKNNHDNFNNSFTKRIRQLIKERGMNQQEFCKDLNLSQATLSRILNCTLYPSNQFVRKLDEYFKTGNMLETIRNNIQDWTKPYTYCLVHVYGVYIPHINSTLLSLPDCEVDQELILEGDIDYKKLLNSNVIFNHEYQYYIVLINEKRKIINCAKIVNN